MNTQQTLTSAEPDELAEMVLADDIARLSVLPSLIGEVCLSEDEAAAVGAALAADDMAEVGRIFSAARDRKVAEEIEIKTGYDMTEREAVERLLEVYA